MKKFIVAIMAFVYLGVSTGIAMNVHYCMGKISSVGLLPGKNTCGKCGMKKGNGGCCKDELKIVKLSDAHKLISNELNLTQPVAVLPGHFSEFDDNLVFSAINFSINNNSPPEHTGISLNILHGVFRI